MAMNIGGVEQPDVQITLIDRSPRDHPEGFPSGFIKYNLQLGVNCGRAALPNSILLNGANVSRKHAFFFAQHEDGQNKIKVRNESKINRLQVKGRRSRKTLKYQKETTLESEQTIELGNYLLKVRITPKFKDCTLDSVLFSFLCIVECGSGPLVMGTTETSSGEDLPDP